MAILGGDVDRLVAVLRVPHVAVLLGEDAARLGLVPATELDIRREENIDG